MPSCPRSEAVLVPWMFVDCLTDLAQLVLSDTHFI